MACSILIMAVDDDDDPMLGCLEELFEVSSEIHFKVSMQTIVHYSVHFHAYVITSNSPMPKNTNLSRLMIFLAHFLFIQELWAPSLLQVSMLFYWNMVYVHCNYMYNATCVNTKINIKLILITSFTSIQLHWIWDTTSLMLYMLTVQNHTKCMACMPSGLYM